MYTSSFRPSMLAISVVAALASPGWAAPVPALTANSAASAGVVAGTPATFSFPSFESSYTTASVASVGDSHGSGFANQYGAYGVGSAAQGIASGNGGSSLLYTLLNSTGVAQQYSLTFKIYGGSISAAVFDPAGLTGLESLASQYSASIKVNGSSVFTSAASVAQANSGPSESKSGVDLNPGDIVSDGFYSWGEQYFVIDLGIVADGGQIDVLAELAQASSANVGTYVFDSGGGGYECYGGEQSFAFAAVVGDVEPCTAFKGQAHGFYGDPATFANAGDADNGGPNDQGLVFRAAAVVLPEPGSLGLALLGLGVAAARRRRPG